MLRHLRGRGFAEKELVAAGLARRAGLYDFFQAGCCGRSGTRAARCSGFGARRLFDDDRLPAKYINTPETPLYKKSHVLYGLDLARTRSQEEPGGGGRGLHRRDGRPLSGVNTAVASCGTAFGDDHARLLRRLMGITTPSAAR